MFDVRHTRFDAASARLEQSDNFPYQLCTDIHINRQFNTIY
jgi:hypothetical protein